MTTGKKINDYQLSQADMNDARETEYYDPTGAKQKGYEINDKTYKDQYGKERIDVGSKVQTQDKKWWELTDDGGVEIDQPVMNETSEKIATPPITSYDMNNVFTPKEQELYGIIDALTGAINTKQPTETMSRDEAQARATAQLRQPFNESLEDTMKAYDQSAIQRGMFGQMPTEVIKREAMADVELDEQQAINQLSSDLFQQDFEMGQAQDQASMNLDLNKLAANRAQLSDEKQMKGEVQDIKNTEIMQKSAQEQATIDNAYEKWESLGYADASVANALGIQEGTPSSDNMKLQMENQYDMALAEYKSLLELQEMSQKYGYDMSKIGYTSQSGVNAAMQKAEIDLWKLSQAADIDIEKDLTKNINENEIKKDFMQWESTLVSPAKKLEAFELAVDMVSGDGDVKDAALEILKKEQIKSPKYDSDGNVLESGGDFNASSIIKEMEALFNDPEITDIMSTFNGLMNVMGGDTSGGFDIPESDYGGAYGDESIKAYNE